MDWRREVITNDCPTDHDFSGVILLQHELTAVKKVEASVSPAKAELKRTVIVSQTTNRRQRVAQRERTNWKNNNVMGVSCHSYNSSWKVNVQVKWKVSGKDNQDAVGACKGQVWADSKEGLKGQFLGKWEGHSQRSMKRSMKRPINAKGIGKVNSMERQRSI